MNASIVRVGRQIAAILLAFMLAIVIAQVVMRYAFAAPFSWAEELAKAMMVWVTFLVAPWAYRAHDFVAIEMFVDAFSERFRLMLGLFIHLLILWLLWVFTLESIDFWERGQATMAATLPLALSYFYSIVPVSFAALSLIAVEQITRIALTLITRDDHRVGTGLTEETR